MTDCNCNPNIYISGKPVHQAWCLASTPLFSPSPITSVNEDLKRFELLNEIAISAYSSGMPYIDLPYEVNYTASLDKRCEHEFKHYEGLTQVYDYCVKCDLKKE